MAFILYREPICVSPVWIRLHRVEDEILRFEMAVEIVSQRLRMIRDEILPGYPGQDRRIHRQPPVDDREPHTERQCDQPDRQPDPNTEWTLQHTVTH